MLSLEDRKKIREQLPHGAFTEIAKKSHFSQCTISFWFSGKSNSSKAENIILDYYIKYKNERDEKLKAAGLL